MKSRQSRPAQQLRPHLVPTGFAVWHDASNQFPSLGKIATWFESAGRIPAGLARCWQGERRSVADRRSGQRHPALSAWTQLEPRTLLTTTVFLDFGEGFGPGGLTMTAAQLRDTLNGPDLISATKPMGQPAIVDATPLRFDPLSTLVQNNAIDYDGTGGAGDSADYIALRDSVVSLVTRYYAPFDVNVVVNAARTLADVTTALAANAGDPTGQFDAYAFVNGIFRTDLTTDLSVGVNTANFGIAAGFDIGEANNTRDDSALVFAENILNSGFATNTLDTRLGYTSAHEPAHTLKLAHTDSGSSNADQRLLARSDLIVGSAFSENRENFDFFTRAPLLLDNSTVPVVNYDRFANDTDIGLRANAPAYVTGTGAFDRITVTRTNATSAHVKLEAFRDATYSAGSLIPLDGANSYEYDINDLTNGILIEAGYGDDQIILDADLGTTITVHGMEGDDQLIVMGKGAASGTYTPGTNSANGLDDHPDLRGTIVIGTTTINFTEFETGGGITVRDVQSFQMVTPLSNDSLTISSDVAGQNRISGRSGGVDIVPLNFFNVVNFTLDTGLNDLATPDDSVQLNIEGLVAAGLENFTINTGAGNDLFQAFGNFALPVAGGSFVYNAGTGNADNLIITATGTSDGNFAPNGGTAYSGIYTEDGTRLFTTGLEQSEVSGFSTFALTTPNDGNIATITPDLAGSGFSGENRVAGSSGGVAFSSVSFYQTDSFLIDTATNNAGGLRGDQFLIDNPGGPALIAENLTNFTIRSGPGSDILTINANDFRLPVLGGLFTFNAGIGTFLDGTPGSNLRGLISLDQVVVNADVDFYLDDAGTTLVGGTTIPDLTASGSNLLIAAAGSGNAAGGGLGLLRLVSVENARLVGGASSNRIDASNFSGNTELVGLGGNDILLGGAGDNVLDGGDGDDTLFAGEDRFLTPGLGSQARVLLGGGGRNTLRGGAGQDTLHADLGGTAELFGDGDADAFIITNQAGLLTAPIGGISVNGGGQAGDTLNLVGGGGSTYNQFYVLDLTAGEGQIVTTNNLNPTGPTISQFVRFTGLTTINDSITANQLQVVAGSATTPIALSSPITASGDQLKLTLADPFLLTLNLASKGHLIVQLPPSAASPTLEPLPLLALPVTTLVQEASPAISDATPVVAAAQILTTPATVAVVQPLTATVAGPVAFNSLATPAVTLKIKGHGLQRAAAHQALAHHKAAQAANQASHRQAARKTTVHTTTTHHPKATLARSVKAAAGRRK